MRSFINTFKADVLFQWKQGFYGIYFVLTLVYILLLRHVPQSWLRYALPMIVYSDPSVLGMFFIGGIILLEREQGILDLMTIIPMETAIYLISKILSLTLIGLLSTYAIILSLNLEDINSLLLVISLLLTSVFYTSLGILISTKVQSVNGYFVKIVPWTLVLILPCLLYPRFDILAVCPSYASLKLVILSFNLNFQRSDLILCLYMLLVDMILFLKAIRTLEESIFLEGA